MDAVHEDRKTTTTPPPTTTTTSTTTPTTTTTKNMTPDEQLKQLQQLQMDPTDTTVPLLDIKDRSYYLSSYRKCFLGSELVDVLIHRYHLQTRDEAVEIGRMLYQSKMFTHVTNDHPFNDDKLFYRFACDEEPLVLNTWRLWNDRVDPDAVGLIRRLKKMLSRLIRKCSTASSTTMLSPTIPILKSLKKLRVNCKV